MLEKIKEISKLIFIPTAILYFLGLICINAYYARFGIVNFDAINTRFIIAGFYPAISLALVIYLSWFLSSRLPIKNFFTSEKWKERYLNMLAFFLYTVTGSTLLEFFMQLGKYKFPSSQTTLTFSPPLFKYDYIGKLISLIPIKSPVSVSYILKYGLYIFGFVFLLFVVVVFFLYIFKLFKKDNSSNNETKIAQMDLQPIPVSEQSIMTNRNSFLITAGDLFFICFFVSVLMYCGAKLNVELFDFNSLNNDSLVNMGLIFSWVFSSSITVYVFLHTFNLNNIRYDLKEKIGNFSDIHWFIQQLILPLLGALFIFGATIFPKIPFAIGGGQPREVKIITNDNAYLFQDDRIYLIGENNQSYFIVTKNDSKRTGKAIQISKGSVMYIETKVLPPEDLKTE